MQDEDEEMLPVANPKSHFPFTHAPGVTPPQSDDFLFSDDLIEAEEESNMEEDRI